MTKRRRNIRERLTKEARPTEPRSPRIFAKITDGGATGITDRAASLDAAYGGGAQSSLSPFFFHQQRKQPANSPDLRSVEPHARQAQNNKGRKRNNYGRARGSKERTKKFTLIEESSA